MGDASRASAALAGGVLMDRSGNPTLRKGSDIRDSEEMAWLCNTQKQSEEVEKSMPSPVSFHARIC
jgi:hypothetical protein